MSDQISIQAWDLVPGLTDQAAELLDTRGIDVDRAELAGVCSAAPKPGSKWAKEAGPDEVWIAFPYIRSHKVVNWAFRTIQGDKKFAQMKGGERCFWNQDVLLDETLHGRTDLIITEGQLDSLTALTCGKSAVMSVPDGVSIRKNEDDDPLSSSKYRYVNDALPLIEKFLQSTSDAKDAKPRSLILAVDDDEAGRHLYADLVRVFGQSRCKFVRYGKDCKDLNDVMIAAGHSAVVELLDRACWHQVDGLYRLSTLPPMPIYEPHCCGIGQIDEIWRFRPGEMSIVIGYPGSGKSTLMNHIAIQMIKLHGWSTVFASFEQPPRPMHVPNLMRCILGRDPNRCTPEEVKRAEAFIENNIEFIWPSINDDPTTDWLSERIVTSCQRSNTRLAIVDPMSAVSDDRLQGYNETQWTKIQLTQFQRLCIIYGIHLVLIVHPRKPNMTGGKLKAPGGYEADGSAHWNNKADVGVSVFREEGGGNIAKVNSWKVRDQPACGKPGHRELGFNAISNRFASVQQPGSPEFN